MKHYLPRLTPEQLLERWSTVLSWDSMRGDDKINEAILLDSQMCIPLEDDYDSEDI